MDISKMNIDRPARAAFVGLAAVLGLVGECDAMLRGERSIVSEFDRCSTQHFTAVAQIGGVPRVRP